MICTKTNYQALNERIEKTKENKVELLLTLKYPEIPLHNNAAELGARAQVRKRDVSLHTMTEEGTKASDTFLTIVQTAKKLENAVIYWQISGNAFVDFRNYQSIWRGYDVHFILPFFIQLFMFMSPVIYPSTLIGEKYQWRLYLNPMTGLINAHRAVLLGHAPLDFVGLGYSIVISVVIFLTGALYLKNTEKYFADLI